MTDKPIPVLLIDDDEDAYILTRDLLEDIGAKKFSLDWVNTYEAGFEAMQRRQHDVVLLDYQLGARNGLELLLEATNGGYTGPVIMLTGAGEHDVDFAAMKSGVADYLVKGHITAPLLERSIRYAIERTRTLNQLQHLNETLEEKVKERTAQLEKSHQELRKAQEQFYQAQKMESLGTLAGGMAHDFGNLISVATLQVDLIQKELEKGGENLAEVRESTQRRIGKIREPLNQAHDLVQQVLLFSRRQNVAFAPINLNDVTNNLVKILLGTLGEKFSLETRLAQELPLIHAHAGQVQQVLMNLILNARDAMPEGGTISVTTQVVSITEHDSRNIKALGSGSQGSAANGFGNARAGQFVRLSVQDAGMGMDEETISQIFDPFFTTKGPGKGTGLGLSVVYGIAKEHQAWILVDSSRGKGAGFSVHFPIMKPDSQTLDSDANVLVRFAK